MAKQVQSKHPASGSWTGGSIQRLDLRAYQKQHCAQGRDGGLGPRPIRAGWHRHTETKEGDPGIKETQAGKGREAGAKSFEEKRGSHHGLSIPLSLHGRGSALSRGRNDMG